MAQCTTSLLQYIPLGKHLKAKDVGPQDWTGVNMGTIYVARHSKSVVHVGPRDWTRVIVGTIEIVKPSIQNR